jgi:dimethylglycine dehydrogenase
MEAGEEFSVKPFGIRAMDSLRIEKSYKLVGTEMSIEYAAYESGLDRFVHLNKGNFIGRDALVKWQQDGFDNKMVTLEVFDINDADALGNNAIYSDDKVIGRATGGNYGFRVKKSLAIAMVKPEFSKVGTELEMDILDKKHKVVVIEDSPYDSMNEKIRA